MRSRSRGRCRAAIPKRRALSTSSAQPDRKQYRKHYVNLLRALFTRNLLLSAVASVRYIPRAFRVKQVDGNLFFTEQKRQEYRRRVESVTPHSPRQWGTMEIDQMLHHLNLACGSSLGFYNLPTKVTSLRVASL